MTEITRINATVPKTLGDYAELRVKTGSFGNKSEYIRHLIREDQLTYREQQINWLNKMLQQSEASGVVKDSREDLLAAGRDIIKKVTKDSI